MRLEVIAKEIEVNYFKIDSNNLKNIIKGIMKSSIDYGYDYGIESYCSNYHA